MGKQSFQENNKLNDKSKVTSNPRISIDEEQNDKIFTLLSNFTFVKSVIAIKQIPEKSIRSPRKEPRSSNDKIDSSLMKETFLQFRRLSIDPLIKCIYAIHTIPSRLFSLARENPFVRSISSNPSRQRTLYSIFPINPKLHAVHCLSIFPLIIRFSRERKNSRFLDCFTRTVSPIEEKLDRKWHGRSFHASEGVEKLRCTHRACMCATA